MHGVSHAQETMWGEARLGAQCKGIAIADGFCGKHGGASTCPKYTSGNVHTVTHDFYSSALFDKGDRDLYSWGVIGNLDDEIRLAKVKPYHYVKQAGGIDLQTVVDSALEVIYKQDIHFESVPYDRHELKAEPQIMRI